MASHSLHACFRLQLVREDAIPEGRALVPGCGRGYDVALLASPTRFVVGLEYSPTAAASAREYIAAFHSEKLPYCRIDEGDFFAYAPAEPFDFIYDYTFFCALPPTMRPSWGKQMSALLAPTGTLLTLQFPLTPQPVGSVEDFTRGPPFQLKPAFYHDALDPHGMVVKSEGDIDAELSDPRRAGERFLMWQHSSR